jgi:DNA-binding HxlR family transcriptional regulator
MYQYQRKLPVKKSLPIDIALGVLRNKWAINILICINNGVRRPGEIQKVLQIDFVIAARVIRVQLRGLIESGILTKKIYPVVPPKVEYFLTPIGQELMIAIKDLEKWAIKYEAGRKQEDTYVTSCNVGEIDQVQEQENNVQSIYN